jgi:hypothetical protein
MTIYRSRNCGGIFLSPQFFFRFADLSLEFKELGLAVCPTRLKFYEFKNNRFADCANPSAAAHQLLQLTVGHQDGFKS